MTVLVKPIANRLLRILFPAVEVFCFQLESELVYRRKSAPNNIKRMKPVLGNGEACFRN